MSTSPTKSAYPTTRTTSLNPPATMANLSVQGARDRLRALGLYGLASQAEELMHEPWIERVLEIEEAERHRRSLNRRMGNARLGTFKALADFDWTWPKQCDRSLVQELYSLAFIEEAANVVMIGPNGLGKTMLLKNIAHQAVLQGYSARFTLASDMLHDLAAQDSSVEIGRAHV